MAHARSSAALPVLLLLLAGCQAPTEPIEEDPIVVPEDIPPAAGFDGLAAHRFVAGLITNETGGPRYRIPGEPGHGEAAVWLWDQMQVAGWQARWQNFSYDDYEELDKGPVDGYARPSACSPSDLQRLDDVTFHNFVAVRQAGPTPSDRLFLLGAHWESKAEASQADNPSRRQEPVLGANDGASGVGVLLQLMRHLTDEAIQLNYDVGVVFFDAEDGFEDCHPLAGSLYHVATLTPGQVDRFLLLDMVGDPQARFMREERSTESDPALVDLVWAYGKEYSPVNFIDKVHPVLDDHIPFIEADIPSADLIDFGRGPTQRGFPPYWHTTEDTLDKVAPEMLGVVGDILVGVMEDPLFDQSLRPL